MSRINNLMKDKECHNERHNVFVCDYIKYIPEGITENDRFKAVSIKEILAIWGYESMYDEMIDRCVMRIKNNSKLNTCIYYDHGDFDNNQSHQKLLGFDIYNEDTNRFEIVGGILFHNGEMSFHT